MLSPGQIDAGQIDRDFRRGDLKKGSTSGPAMSTRVGRREWSPLFCTSHHGRRGLCSQAAYSIVGTAAEDAERRLNGPPIRLV